MNKKVICPKCKKKFVPREWYNPQNKGKNKCRGSVCLYDFIKILKIKKI